MQTAGRSVVAGSQRALGHRPADGRHWPSGIPTAQPLTPRRDAEPGEETFTENERKTVDPAPPLPNLGPRLRHIAGDRRLRCPYPRRQTSGVTRAFGS